MRSRTRQSLGGGADFTSRLQTSAVFFVVPAVYLHHPAAVEMAVRLSHSLFGSGGGGLTPAVILHGLFGSGNNWRTIASKLASETNRLVKKIRHVVVFHINLTDKH